MNWLKKMFRKIFRRQAGDNQTTPSKPKEEIEVKPDIPDQEPIKEDWQRILRAGDKGIDISHHNKNVNLALVDQDFIFMKATEGSNFISPVYHQRMNEAIKLQKNVGAYHYYRINSDPILQAKHFCKHIKGNLPPVLDIESINNDGYRDRVHTPQLLKFLEYVEKETGMIPIVYLGYYFCKDFIKPTPEFEKYPLWLAWYTNDESKLKVPSPWKHWTFWQYSETATVDGVGKCDVNYYLSKKK